MPEATATWSPKTNDLISTFEKMSLVELKEFKEAYEGHFGVTAAAAVAMAAAPGAGGSAAAAVEEKTQFDVVLMGAGDKKIQVIKVVREITSLGLKEAKDLVDSAPKAVKTGLPKAEAEEIKKKLDEAGAAVEIK